jgi:WD40 repeat protein
MRRFPMFFLLTLLLAACQQPSPAATSTGPLTHAASATPSTAAHLITRLGIGLVFDADVSSDGSTAVVSATTGVYSYSLPDLTPIEHGLRQYSVALSPDGKRYLTGGPAADITYLWDTASGEEIALLEGSSGEPLWSPTGRYIAAVEQPFDWYTSSGRIILYDGYTGEQIRILESNIPVYVDSGFESSFGITHWSPNDRHFVACMFGDESDLVIWDADTGEVLTDEGEWADLGPIDCSLSFSPDGMFLANAMDNRVEIREVETGALQLTLPISAPYRIAWSPDGSRIIVIGDALSTWDAATGDQISQNSFQQSMYGETIMWSPDSQRVAVVSGQKILILDSDGSQLLKFDLDSEGWDTSFNWLPDSRRALYTDRDEVLLWDITSGETISRLKSTIESYQFGWSPDSRYLLFDSEGQQYWDSVMGERYDGLPEGVEPADTDDLRYRESFVSPDGRWRFDVSGEEYCEPEALHLPITATRAKIRQVLPRNSCAYEPGIVRLIDTKTRNVGFEQVYEKVDTYSFQGTAWSADSSLLAYAVIDRTVDKSILNIVDVAGGKIAAMIDGPGLGDLRMVFSPDNTMLAAISNDATVMIWRLDYHP